MRALAFVQASEIDRARHEPDEADRTAAHERVELLTPLVKSFCTDRAEQVTSIGIQVHGGMGYIEETGVAQYYRDVKITQIYEGTNGIQAMDLVARKVPMRQGGVIADLVGEMRATVAELADAGDRLEIRCGSSSRPPSTPSTPRTRGCSSRASADPVEALAVAIALPAPAGDGGGGVAHRPRRARRPSASGPRATTSSRRRS